MTEPSFFAQYSTLLVLLGLLLLLVIGRVLLRAARRTQAAAAIRVAQAAEDIVQLPGPWQALRDEVEITNRVLSRPVYDRARQIFLDYYAGQEADGQPLTPAGLTREYDAREEFLLVVDEHGRPAISSLEMLVSYRKTAAARPEFRRWFREEPLQEGEFAATPILLPARWLCHLVGLRHSTVEIFIDPPDLEGHTLVQVRGMDKFEAPGAFDIPCAGHVDGVDGIEESLRKELGEELNLSLTQLEGLRLIGRYNSYAVDHNDDQPLGLSINNEHRVLYRARLKADAAAGIRFSDGEVAGLAVFAVSELRTLAQRYPERIASGLGDALAYYQ